MRVAPIEVQVLEPLKKLKVIVEPNAYGISAEITLTGRTAPIEDDRLILADGPRTIIDTFRLVQHMDWEGRIEAFGEMIDLKGWRGTRDRSWGVRSIGIRDPQPYVPPRPLPLFWLGGPQIYDDYGVYFHAMDDEQGRVRSRMCVLHAADGSAPRRLDDVSFKLDYRSGTRLIAKADIRGRFAGRRRSAARIFPRGAGEYAGRRLQPSDLEPGHVPRRSCAVWPDVQHERAGSQ